MISQPIELLPKWKIYSSNMQSGFVTTSLEKAQEIK
jgi:hypothetical protein